jgi:hypothetical protein
MLQYTNLAALIGQGDTMSRSNSKSAKTSTSSTRTPAPAREAVVRSKRDISRYSFEYQRDRVSRQAGASYFRVNGEDGESLDMSLQEAQSLYNFLGSVLTRK